MKAIMEDYPSLAEGTGLENQQRINVLRGFESLNLRHLLKKLNIAGWSSLVARRAHNPKVVGSNPAPAIWSYGVGVITPACHAGDHRFKSG